MKMFQSKSFEAFTAGRHRLESGSSTINSLPSDISNKFVACDGAPAKNAINNFMTRCWNVDKRVLHLKERFYDTFFVRESLGASLLV